MHVETYRMHHDLQIACQISRDIRIAWHCLLARYSLRGSLEQRSHGDAVISFVVSVLLQFANRHVWQRDDILCACAHAWCFLSEVPQANCRRLQNCGLIFESSSADYTLLKRTTVVHVYKASINRVVCRHTCCIKPEHRARARAHC